MDINFDFLNKNLAKTIKNFVPKLYNNLTIEEKQNTICNFSKMICNCFNTKNTVNPIVFVNNHSFSSAAAFSFYDNNILFKNSFLNNNLNGLSIVTMLDNIIHETVHFCQKENNLFLEDLELTLHYPYNLLQRHEINAYELTDKILLECRKYLPEYLNEEFDAVSMQREFFKEDALSDLKNRGYGASEIEINNQIESMKPFSKNINKIKKFSEEGKLDLKTNKENENINAKFINNELFGIIKIHEEDSANKMLFTIVDDVCYINDLYLEDENQILRPTSRHNKEKLLDILNKIIIFGNENEIFECEEIKINPISIVEDKDSYDKFVEEVENFDIELSVDSKISEEQIGNDIFNDER